MYCKEGKKVIKRITYISDTLSTEYIEQAFTDSSRSFPHVCNAWAQSCADDDEGEYHT